MKQNIILVLKGIIVGIGKIFPGVSGAVLAMSLGIYDKCVKAIGNFTKDIKNNINLLFYVGIGIVISVGIFSNIVIYLLDKYYLLTIYFFTGLIIGGLPKMYIDSKINVKAKSNLLLILISFIIILLLNNLNTINVIKDSANFITLIIIGFIESFAMIVPGVSGTALLMILGYYHLVILRFSTMFNIMNLFETIDFFIPFGIGMVIGAIVMSKLINFCLTNYKDKTYCIIFGLIFASIIILLGNITITNLVEFILGVIFLIFGLIISLMLNLLNNSKV